MTTSPSEHSHGSTASPAHTDSFRFPFDGEGSGSKRQRITMACQYCRHRKIRCCGGTPCKNCTRAQRPCEYTPVPDEVNRMTREKKAVAKASKTSSSPAPPYSPFVGENPVFDVPYTSGPPSCTPPQLHHRRTASVPVAEASSAWVPPSTPSNNQSPAMYESYQWFYSGGWSSVAPTTPPVQPSIAPSNAYPSVLEQTPANQAYLNAQRSLGTPSDSRASSAESDPFNTSWSTPKMGTSNHVRPMIPITPLNSFQQQFPSPRTPASVYHTPYAHPTPLFQSSHFAPNGYSPAHVALASSTSPTLAPEMSHPKDLIGLGIGVNEPDMFPTPAFSPEEYFASPQF